MKKQLAQILEKITKEFGVNDLVPEVVQTQDLRFGDYTTNMAMVLAKQMQRNPLEIAEEIKHKLSATSQRSLAGEPEHSTDQSHQTISGIGDKIDVLQDIESVEVVPPGFINFRLSASAVIKRMQQVLNEKEAYGKGQLKPGKKVMVEFAHPNTHKTLHIGHLRNMATGEALVRLLESQGIAVVRSNYQGDVGMHIAKAMYGLLNISPYKDELKATKGIFKRVEFLGKAYAAGSQAYEKDQAAKGKIHDYNFLIYAAAQKFRLEQGKDTGSTDYTQFVKGDKYELDLVYEVWKETRQWSLDYYEEIYKLMGTHFDRYYFESECLAGVDMAKQAVRTGVLEESDGAIIFRGQPHGLDTRVFVNNLGLPTYEAKELALAEMEFSEFGELEKNIHVVGPEQASFFKVTFKVEELLNPLKYKNKQYHLDYGWVRLKHGKMSSRLGNVVTAEQLINEIKHEIYNILNKSASNYTEIQQEEIAEKAAIAAIKYSFLKVSVRQEIAFDLKESVNFEGDSGPYLQYAYTRAVSVLEKANQKTLKFELNDKFDLNQEEKLVLRLIYKFPEAVCEAAENFGPNILCKYLFELAGAFNTFYSRHSIIQADKRDLKQFRLGLTEAVSWVLKNGLHLLGFAVLEKM